MNYIGLLTKEEKSTLCEIISGKELKELFVKNEQEFLKIKRGYRAKSLNEHQALSIAIAHVDKPFIATMVNTFVEYWLREIEENIVKLEGEGSSHSTALAKTMLDSCFVNNVELYFKLTGSSLNTDACSNLYERMEDIKSERARNAEISNKIKSIEEENQRLSNQVTEAHHSINIIKTEYEEKIQKIEQDKSELSSLLDEARAKVSELQTGPSDFSGDDADCLAQFDDTDISILPSVNTNEIVSLCGVVSDFNGQKWLKRYADLNNNGNYCTFHKNEDNPPYFTNRDKIFWKDGPTEDGFYGVWNWFAVPNENDPSKDYIRSRYNTEIKPIESVTLTEATTLDELANLLKEGINYQPHSQRVMFSIYTSKGEHTGILCITKELTTVNGITNISGNCYSVPIYEFTDDDIIHLDNGLSFYQSAFAGLPSKLYHLKSPLDIVKDIVLSSVSWSTYKTRNVTRTQYKIFKNFIDAIPVDDIICKIRVACCCSSSAAKELLDKFLNIVWKYVDEESLEDEIILSAASVNKKLQEKTKKLIRQDWETENKILLSEERQKLDLLRTELKSAADNLDEARKTLEKTKTEDEHLSCIIAEKKKMAEDVEKAVAERIQKARENVADFVASMAFVGGQQVESTYSAAVDAKLEPVKTIYCSYPEFENFDDLEAHHSWKDVINTAIYELTDAGVAKQYRSGLAAFLCSAYIEKQPILLVGPNAIGIAQAFCAAVTAHKHGTLYCEGGYVREVIEKIGSDGEDIVIINNLLAGGWMNRLPEILSQNDIFYIATHPYAEDIQVEPKSLYSFMLPLFTEFLVDKKATGKYYGGYFSDDFKPYTAGKGTRKELPTLSKFALSSLVRGKINNLMATMHNIYPSTSTDDDFSFLVFPIAYASMNIDKLTEEITDPQNNIKISANLKRDLQCMLGEN